MTINFTQAQRLQAYMAATMYEVMDLLEWDLMLYNMFKYECGLKYLEVHLRGDIEAIRQLEANRAYWGWWKLHWQLREREWLNSLNIGQHENVRMMVLENGVLMNMKRFPPIESPLQGIHGWRAIYMIINNPVDLAQGRSSYGRVLDDSYCKDLVRELR